jgi:hypothetical protein
VRRSALPLLLLAWAALAAGALAAAGAAGPTGWKPRVEVASKGAVRAELSYQYRRTSGLLEFRSERLRILVSGRVRLNEALVPPACRLCPAQPAGAFGLPSRSVTVRDIDGDGELDVVADFYTGGAHCCFFSLIFGYRPGSDTFGSIQHAWGDPGYGFEDYDHDGTVEFLTADDRFAYAFTCYACSLLPIQIWHYRSGALVDVTRAFPRQVRADASRSWRLYLRERRRRDGDVRGILAAYLADKYLLGTQADGWRRLRQANARGELHPTGACFAGTPCDGRYLTRLDRFLRQTGYRR